MGLAGFRWGDQWRAPWISSADNDSKSQMRSTQLKCSGFMSTERKQVRVSRSRFIAPRFFSQKRIGNSATAKSRSPFAAASNILRLRTEAVLTLAAFGRHKTLSNHCHKDV